MSKKLMNVKSVGYTECVQTFSDDSYFMQKKPGAWTCCCGIYMLGVIVITRNILPEHVARNRCDRR